MEAEAKMSLPEDIPGQIRELLERSRRLRTRSETVDNSVDDLRRRVAESRGSTQRGGTDRDRDSGLQEDFR
jgi:hypothetical protein